MLKKKQIKKLTKCFDKFDPKQFNEKKWLEALALCKEVLETTRVDISKETQYSAATTVTCDDTADIIDQIIKFSLKRTNHSSLIVPFLTFSLAYAQFGKAE